ncbi:MAG: glycosyltransferase [Bdellovibrionales bacterium]|nr:glycosyltransferase [Bdellovibrionales bacterium]
MRVLLFHPVKLPVVRYGGTERVVMWLAQTLKKLGHEVSVFAAPGSSMPDGIGCETDPERLKTLAREFDVIHGFSKIDSQIETDFGGRVLVTIQGNGQMSERFHPNTVFVSRNHAERHGATEFVYNGLDPDELKFSAKTRPDRFLFLSKTSWKVKNLRGAVRAVARNRKNLWIAGGSGPVFLRGYTALKGALGADWNWVGSVDQKQKADFLLEGKAMLFPLLWNEPFGIVMTEALVSGTPVFAHPYGSVPEVLEFAPQCLLKSENDWDRAVRSDIKMPSARECRDWVLAKFDQVTMTKKYLDYYAQVASGKKLHAHEPETRVTAEEISR